MLIDTHAHLYWDSFKEDFNEVIKRSLEAGVTTIINVGVDIELSKIALRQAQAELANIPGFTAYSTIGIHPHEAVKYSSDVSIHNGIEELAKIYKQSLRSDDLQSQPDQSFDSAQGRIVAVGECGLDFFFGNNPQPSSLPITKQKDLQIQLFQAQIDLAKKLNLPLIVHCRDDRSENLENSEAWDVVLEMVGNHSTIFHCYSGLNKTTQQILNMPNALISFAGTITYPKNEYLREIAKILPLKKIVLETDCPFLPPQSKRGQRNEPASVKEIAQLIADLKKASINKVSTQTTANAKQIFHI